MGPQFPLLDPRPFYLQWATATATATGHSPLANPYLAGLRGPGPGPVPPPYLHSLAQWNNLKALMAQQNLAKSLLQASGSNSATQTAPHSAPQTHCKTFTLYQT